MIPTIEILKHFTTKYSNYDFYFVVGTDNIKSIHTWKQY
jgi:nicotinic acid mononucleotide adenylyltransferase